MTVITVIGDAATTTAAALAVAWRSDDDVVLVEADPRGGSLAAWLDVPVEPSLSAVVAHAGARDEAGTPVGSLGRLTPSGVRLLPAPVSAVEATRALASADAVFDELARAADRVAVVDAGVPSAAVAVPAPVRVADAVVVVHRVAAPSPRAAAVRLERFTELVGVVRAHCSASAVVLALVGAGPFPPDETVAFVDNATRSTGGSGVGPLPYALLPLDPVAAAVLGGRAGMSPRRFRRLPLVRAAQELADRLRVAVRDADGASVLERWT